MSCPSMNVVLNFLLLLCYCQFLPLCLLLFTHISLCVPMLDCESESEKGFPGASASKESDRNAGALGLILGLGSFPGEGKCYPLQYSGLENSMNCIVHGVAKSWTWLSDFHFDFSCWFHVYLQLWYLLGLIPWSLHSVLFHILFQPLLKVYFV